jgi:hypothetical protein
MKEKGYRGGLVSRVKNQHSNKKYTISTAQELGKDYWTSVVFPNVFFGLFPNFGKGMLSVVRNSQEDAIEVHEELKSIVGEMSEEVWFEAMPSPLPTEGLTNDAEATLADKM